MNVSPLCVRRWKHSRDGLMAKIVSVVIVMRLYCFLSIILPHDIAAICVVESTAEGRYLLISAIIIVEFVKEVHPISMFLLQFMIVFEKANPTLHFVARRRERR